MMRSKKVGAKACTERAYPHIEFQDWKQISNSTFSSKLPTQETFRTLQAKFLLHLKAKSERNNQAVIRKSANMTMLVMQHRICSCNDEVVVWMRESGIG